jgi:hypothetical protein
MMIPIDLVTIILISLIEILSFFCNICKLFIMMNITSYLLLGDAINQQFENRSQDLSVQHKSSIESYN